MSAFKRSLLTALIIFFHSTLLAQQLADISPAMRAALKKSFAQASSFPDRFEAEVWLTDMSGRIEHLVSDKLERIRILKAVHANASAQQLPIDIVLSLIETESHFNRFALSPAGAQGLMQIMPFWKKEIGEAQDNLIDIDTNIRYGSSILRHYLDIEDGDMSKALARYNGSRGKSVYPDKVFSYQQKYQ